jgi:hypothetical protein
MPVTLGTQEAEMRREVQSQPVKIKETLSRVEKNPSQTGLAQGPPQNRGGGGALDPYFEFN